jgi:hypothetical protein
MWGGHSARNRPPLPPQANFHFAWGPNFLAGVPGTLFNFGWCSAALLEVGGQAPGC